MKQSNTGRHIYKQAMQITDDVMSKVREPSDDKQQ